MTIDPVLARDFALDINTGTDAAPVWTPVGGITNISPGQDSQKTDDGDFDSGGRARHSVVERSDTFQVDMLYKEDDTGTRDAGQQAILDVARLYGAAAKVPFRYVFPSGTEGVEFKASVDLPYPGGGKTDNAAWQATLTVDGDITEVAIP